jgi:hypothetical protein
VWIWTQEQPARQLVGLGTTIRANRAPQEDGLLVAVPGRGIFTAPAADIARAKRELRRR